MLRFVNDFHLDTDGTENCSQAAGSLESSFVLRVFGGINWLFVHGLILVPGISLIAQLAADFVEYQSRLVWRDSRPPPRPLLASSRRNPLRVNSQTFSV